MSVSRMESESLELVPEKIDATILASSTLERLKPAAQAKNVSLSTSHAQSPQHCICDPAHIQQVLLNLIGNAIKFSPDGTTVEVMVSSDNTTTTFCVKDHGPGIQEKEHDRIFHKYYRVPSVRDSVDGAGLGLSIARRIVNAHGGRMWIVSEPGHGSTFCFSLPTNGDKESR